MAPTRMSGRTKRVMALVISTLLLAVLFPPSTRANEEHAGSKPEMFMACEHPYPCGDEWPEHMFDFRFEIKDVVHMRVPSHDGTVLEGWVGLPDVPEGMRVPVLLHSTPYLGDCYAVGCDPTPADEDWWSHDKTPQWATTGWGAKPIDLVEMGYAVAYFSVRGTGGSGGCFDLYGSDEASDQAFLVDHLADQEKHYWSNGRVAMAGNSYAAATAIEAAVADANPGDPIEQVGSSALKTIVVSGIVSDLYTLTHTPQGLFKLNYTPERALLASSATVTPPLSDKPVGNIDDPSLKRAQDRAQTYVGVAPERTCVGGAQAVSQGSESLVADSRDEAFYSERRFLDSFPQVTTSVLLGHGIADYMHRFQWGFAWNALENAPKRQLAGAWRHSIPSDEYAKSKNGPYEFDGSWAANEWATILEQWLNFWMKGRGVEHPGMNEIPEDLRLNTVDYQDTNKNVWRESSSWPPAEVREEALYFASGSIDPLPSDSSATFQSVPSIGNSRRGMATYAAPSPWKPWDALCPVGSAHRLPTSLLFESESLTEDVTIAGQPFVHVKMKSSRPGGAVAATLADLGPNFTCDAAGQPSDVRYVANGGADLRFHSGNLTGQDFPVDVSTPIRIDLGDIATTVEAGHRLVVVLSFGEPHVETWTQPYYPEITIEGGENGSHIVLPFVEGTMGGAAPTMQYPPRPFGV